MSWYDKAKPPLKAYYVIVSPERYYEWEHEGILPSDIKIGYGNVRQLKSFDKMIFAIDNNTGPIPIDNLTFISGKAKSKSDVLTDYQNLQDKYNSDFEMFKSALQTRGYFVDIDSDKPCLHNVAHISDNKVHLENYGPWEAIHKKARLAQLALDSSISPAYYKAKDLEPLHDLTHALLATDYSRPVNKESIITILRNAGQKPISNRDATWDELYKMLDVSAKKNSDRLFKLSKFKWIQNSGRM